MLVRWVADGNWIVQNRHSMTQRQEQGRVVTETEKGELRRLDLVAERVSIGVVVAVVRQGRWEGGMCGRD